MQKLSLGRKQPRPAWILGTLHLPVKDRRAKASTQRNLSSLFPSRAIPGILNSHAANRFAMKSKPHIAVVGAGAFGGWTALHLLERGARVTLLDAWGPGNSRASSGGETRIMRGTYGPDQPYTETGRARAQAVGEIRTALEEAVSAPHRRAVDGQQPRRRLRTRLARCASRSRHQVSGTLHAGDEEALAADQLRGCPLGNLRTRMRIPRRPRQLPGGGRCVRRARAARIGSSRSRLRTGRCGPLRSLTLSDGSRLKADHYVFACGPWLGKLFPNFGQRDSPYQAGHFFLRPAGRRLPLHRRASSRVGRSRQAISSTASPAATAAVSKWPMTRVGARSILLTGSEWSVRRR